MTDEALQLWPAIHVGDCNSKQKPVCLGMPSVHIKPIMQKFDSESDTAIFCGRYRA